MSEPPNYPTIPHAYSNVNLIGGISGYVSIQCIEHNKDNILIVSKPIRTIKPGDYVFTGVNQIYTKVVLVLKYSDNTPCMLFHCDNKEPLYLSINQLMYKENKIISAINNEFDLPEPHTFNGTLYTLVLSDIHRIQINEYNLICCFHEFLSDPSIYEELIKINSDQNSPNQIDLSKMHFLINPQTKKILSIQKIPTQQ